MCCNPVIPSSQEVQDGSEQKGNCGGTRRGSVARELNIGADKGCYIVLKVWELGVSSLSLRRRDREAPAGAAAALLRRETRGEHGPIERELGGPERIGIRQFIVEREFSGFAIGRLVALSRFKRSRPAPRRTEKVRLRTGSAAHFNRIYRRLKLGKTRVRNIGFCQQCHRHPQPLARCRC